MGLKLIETLVGIGIMAIVVIVVVNEARKQSKKPKL